jgi:hypothetical protein
MAPCAMAMAMAGKQKKVFWRELRHKGGCCCFGWFVYAPWAFYMGIWALYNPKLPLWLLIGLPDLEGDHTHRLVIVRVRFRW